MTQLEILKDALVTARLKVAFAKVLAGRNVSASLKTAITNLVFIESEIKRLESEQQPTIKINYKIRKN